MVWIGNQSNLILYKINLTLTYEYILRKRTLKINIIVISFLLLVVSSCNVEDILNDTENSNITAKTKLNDVLNKAKSDFSIDAQLAAIYGLNVSTKGEIDLSKPDNNAFVYVVQSDLKHSNEFYIPVFGSGPVKWPLNFDSMLSLVKDQAAKVILGKVFNGLSSININSSVSYDDSPAVISKLLERADATSFRNSNPGSKIDMFLVPSKSIDTTNVNNSADWLVNFYGDSTSLVLWLHPGTVSGTVTKISD